MRVEIINTGSELLLGHVTNTHLPWLAQQLFRLGWRVQRQVTVPDGPEIRTSLLEAQSRADLIVITGGLGPTSDDLTRPVIAELLGRPLIFNPRIEEGILARFRQRQLVPCPSVRVQALVPEGAVVLPNDHGTAPGLLLEDDSRTYVVLPGPPSELRPMWTQHVHPWLVEHRATQPVYEKIWRIVGLGESRVQELCEEAVRQIGTFEVGYCARPGEVDFRLLSENPEWLAQAERIVREKVGAYIVGQGAETLEQTVIELARQRHCQLATVESCTGGLVAHRLTNVPGSSEVFQYGWVTYGNVAKVAEVGVSEALLETHGAVSEACVRAMAEGGRLRSGADLAVAISGIAGPGGGTEEKPVGTCWLAISSTRGVESCLKRLAPDREIFKQMAAQAALDLLRRELLKLPA